MEKVFTTQQWTLNLDVGADQTGATAPLIFARAPDGVESSFAATVSTNTLSRPFSVAEIATPGFWTFWASSTLGGLIGIGEPVEIQIFNPGDTKGF